MFIINVIFKTINVNDYDYKDMPILIYAMFNNNMPLTKLLVDKGANVNISYMGQTPLHYALAVNNYDLMKLLVSKKADINAKNTDGLSPLAVAKKAGNKKAMMTLIGK